MMHAKTVPSSTTISVSIMRRNLDNRSMFLNFEANFRLIYSSIVAKEASEDAPGRRISPTSVELEPTRNAAKRAAAGAGLSRTHAGCSRVL